MEIKLNQKKQLVLGGNQAVDFRNNFDLYNTRFLDGRNLHLQLGVFWPHQLVQLVRKISCFNNNSRCFKISTQKIAGNDSFLGRKSARFYRGTTVWHLRFNLTHLSAQVGMVFSKQGQFVDGTCDSIFPAKKASNSQRFHWLGHPHPWVSQQRHLSISTVRLESHKDSEAWLVSSDWNQPLSELELFQHRSTQKKTKTNCRAVGTWITRTDEDEQTCSKTGFFCLYTFENQKPFRLYLRFVMLRNQTPPKNKNKCRPPLPKKTSQPIKWVFFFTCVNHFFPFSTKPLTPSDLRCVATAPWPWWVLPM